MINRKKFCKSVPGLRDSGLVLWVFFHTLGYVRYNVFGKWTYR